MAGGRRGIRVLGVGLGVGLALALAGGMLPACRAVRPPWRDREAIIDTLPGIPPMTLDAMSGRHLVVMRAPTGGWTLHIDKDELRPDGRRVYLTARRPDPAFVHTQALVDLRALTDVPADTPVKLVARVLDHAAKPDDRVYARIEPVEPIDPIEPIEPIQPIEPPLEPIGSPG